MGAGNSIVYLVASGATAWQEAGRLQGGMDMPLSAGGARAVEEAARKWDTGIHGAGLWAIHCAGDEASVATAKAFASKVSCRVKVNDELREVHAGLWQGLTEAELEERYPTAYRQWVEDPTRMAIPEGEPLEEAAARVAGVIGKLLGRGGDRVVVVVLRPIVMRLAMGMVIGTLRDETDGGTGTGTRPAEAGLAGQGMVHEIEMDAAAVKAFRAARRNGTLLVGLSRAEHGDGGPSGKLDASGGAGHGPRRASA